MNAEQVAAIKAMIAKSDADAKKELELAGNEPMKGIQHMARSMFHNGQAMAYVEALKVSGHTYP